MWGGRHCREGEEVRSRWYGHVISRDEGEPVRHGMKTAEDVGW